MDIDKLVEAVRVARLGRALLAQRGDQFKDWPQGRIDRPQLTWQAHGRPLMDLGLLDWNPNPRRSSTKLSGKGDAVCMRLNPQKG